MTAHIEGELEHLLRGHGHAVVGRRDPDKAFGPPGVASGTIHGCPAPIPADISFRLGGCYRRGSVRLHSLSHNAYQADHCGRGSASRRRRLWYAAPGSATTEIMSGTNTKLITAVETYFTDLGRVCASIIVSRISSVGRAVEHCNAIWIKPTLTWFMRSVFE